jgi:tRNA(adenine34) deaminase
VRSLAEVRAAGPGRYGPALVDGADGWSDLAAPWQAAFDLAWESFTAGSLGIGAVLTDPDGHVVAAGRNRLLEDDAPPGQVAGSTVAHAEVNALAGLGWRDRRDGLVLWSTLEPCIQCSGAIVMAGVPDVRFAGGDPLFDGLASIAHCTPFVAARWPRLTGPRHDRFGALGSLLPLVRLAVHEPDGIVVEGYAARYPALADLARTFAATGELDGLVAGGASTADVVATLWDRLPALS